jgi:hypothetical protein
MLSGWAKPSEMRYAIRCAMTRVLARSCAGKDQQRPVNVEHGVALFGIQGGKGIHFGKMQVLSLQSQVSRPVERTGD